MFTPALPNHHYSAAVGMLLSDRWQLSIGADLAPSADRLHLDPEPVVMNLVHPRRRLDLLALAIGGVCPPPARAVPLLPACGLGQNRFAAEVAAAMRCAARLRARSWSWPARATSERRGSFSDVLATTLPEDGGADRVLLQAAAPPLQEHDQQSDPGGDEAERSTGGRAHRL